MHLKLTAGLWIAYEWPEKTWACERFYSPSAEEAPIMSHKSYLVQNIDYGSMSWRLEAGNNPENEKREHKM